MTIVVSERKFAGDLALKPTRSMVSYPVLVFSQKGECINIRFLRSLFAGYIFDGNSYRFEALFSLLHLASLTLSKFRGYSFHS